MVIRGAGEQRHLSLSFAQGRGRGVDKVSVYGDASVAAVSCIHPSSYGEGTLSALASSVLTTEPSRLFS